MGVNPTRLERGFNRETSNERETGATALTESSEFGYSQHRIPFRSHPMEKLSSEYAEWSPALEVGLPHIDAQHRQLFELAATFEGGGDQIRLIKTLAMLSTYIKTHLREEDELMVACGYPRLQEHRELHGEFRRMLISLLDGAKTMSMDTLAQEVRQLINGWFFRHIVGADQDYVPYVKAWQAARSSTAPGEPVPPPLPWEEDRLQG